MTAEFPTLRFKSQLRPAQQAVIDLAQTQLASGERNLRIVALPGAGVLMHSNRSPFLNSSMTVERLIARTHAVSRMPLPLSAISAILAFVSG